VSENRSLIALVGHHLKLEGAAAALFRVLDPHGEAIWKSLGSGQDVGNEVEGEVGADILEVKEKDLIQEDVYDDEDKAEVVVHGNRRCKENDKGENEHA
jgi:hypothetical protein